MYCLAWKQDPDQLQMSVPTYIFCRQVVTPTISSQDKAINMNILLFNLNFLDPDEPHPHRDFSRDVIISKSVLTSISLMHIDLRKAQNAKQEICCHNTEVRSPSPSFQLTIQSSWNHAFQEEAYQIFPTLYKGRAPTLKSNSVLCCISLFSFRSPRKHFKKCNKKTSNSFQNSQI